MHPICIREVNHLRCFQAGRKLLPHGKVPVVCAIIDTIATHNEDASAILRDPTGQYIVVYLYARGNLAMRYPSQ